MQNRRKKKWLTVLAGVMALLISMMQPVKTQAGGTWLAQSPNPIGNLVIFVKFSDDNTDQFNAVGQSAVGSWKYYNWKNLKEMYGSIGQENTFTDYIYRISEGKISVQNFFPQEVAATQEQIDAGSYEYRVETYVLDIPKANYDQNGCDGYIIQKIAEAVNTGVIPLTCDRAALDGNGDDHLDNLTIIMQGDSNGAAAHKGQYGSDGTSGEVTICGLKIYDYNYIPSENLIESVPTGVFTGSQQGVIAHEFLHNFGFPDLYRSGIASYPVGYWDIMSSTSYYLQYPLSYLRARSNVGWIDMRTVSLAEQSGRSATYTLTAVSENVGSGEEKAIAFRTPLTDRELIVLEYRKKSASLERPLYDSGLIAYRVNEGVESNSNKNYTTAESKNYIYVYRPGAVHPEAAMETFDASGVTLNSVRKAALGAGSSYGSTDLAASLTEDTLFYSDGRNSGIRIKDIQFLEGDKKVQFTVEWADYSSTGWTQTGATLSFDAKGTPVLYSDGEALYTAYVENSGGAGKAVVKKWNEAAGAWDSLCSAPSASDYGILTFCVKDGIPRLAYVNSSRQVSCGKIQSGSFSGSSVKGVTDAAQVKFVEKEGHLYLECDSYDGSGAYKVSLWDVESSQMAKSSEMSVEYCVSVDADSWKGDPVAVYSAFFAADRSTKLMKYDSAGWSAFPGYSSGTAQTNTHVLKSSGDKLYVLAGKSSDTATIPVLSVYDGTVWKNISLPSMTWSYMDMEVIGKDVYIAYIANEKLQILRWKDGADSFEVYEELLVSGVSEVDISSVGQNLYVAYRTVEANSGVGNLVVRQKTTDSNVTPSTPDTPPSTPDTPPSTPDTPPSTPDTPPSTPDTPPSTPDTPPSTPDTPPSTPDTPPSTPDTPPSTPDTPPSTPDTPAAARYQVVVDRPSGYDACPDGYSYNPVYIDGVAYKPTVEGTQCKVQLAEGAAGAKVATMYYYQPSSAGDRMLPRGMRVWKLTCDNGVYSAKELTEYRDLLGYYGFAVRLTAPPGLRICSSIKMSEREKLISKGNLVEYGTLAVPKTLFEKYNDFVIGGRSVSQGRAYWKANGKVYDKRYKEDPANDRILFTSVLPDFPDSVKGYTLDLYARPYVIVNYGTETLTIYGAPVNRQFYQVAKQAYDSGNRNEYITHIVKTVGGE